jgi:hypothetical protein
MPYDATGMRWIFHGHCISSFALSVVVDQFNVKSVGSFEAKNDAPIRPHRDRPKPLPFAFERMKAIPGNVESLRRSSRIEGRGNSFHCIHQIRPYTTAVVLFVKPFEAAMFKAPDH